MSLVICDFLTCGYCRKGFINHYCSKKNIDLKNGKCSIAKQMDDMETAIQELKRAQQANNNALTMQNMNRICAEVIEKFYK